MPKVVREDSDQMTAVLTVTVEKQDYESKFQTELNKYRKQAHMKGFRKGKTPMSVLLKMYGRSVLADVVNKLLQDELYRYLTEEDIQILGQPMPSDQQEEIDFDLKDLHDYHFRFDIGIAPKFEVQGIGSGDTYQRYSADITAEMIDQELERGRQRHGKRVNVEAGIREGDLLQLHVVELREDGQVKEGGVESDFGLLTENVDNEEAKSQLLAAKPGDQLRLNLFSLEKNTSDSYVRRYFLKLEEGDDREVGQEFEVTIKEASRIEPAEFDQEFFDKIAGEGKVSSEEELRAHIENDLRRFYDEQAGALLFRDFQERLLEKNQLELPHEFLRRWLKASNAKLTDEQIDAEYDQFAQNLRWSLIRGKLVRDLGIEVTDELVLDRFKDRIRGYFGGAAAGDDLINSMAARLLQDEKQYEQVYEDVLTDKLHEAIEQRVSIEPKPISVEAFRQLIQEAREAVEKARAKPLAAEEEE